MARKIDASKNRVELAKDDKVGKRVPRLEIAIMLLASIAIVVVYFANAGQAQGSRSLGNGDESAASALPVPEDGKQIFRFDTFGDEAFWGDTRPVASITMVVLRLCSTSSITTTTSADWL